MNRFCLRYSQYFSISISTTAFISRYRISRFNGEGGGGGGGGGVQNLEFFCENRRGGNFSGGSFPGGNFLGWKFSGWELS